MVNLHFYRQEDFSEVNYVLDDIQSVFTVSAAFALERIETRKTGTAYPVTIFFEKRRAGFFVLDFGHDKFDITDNQHAVLLRALSVNPSMQGKGIGKQVMIEVDHFVRRNFENCNEIVLAVNQDNTSAFGLYLKAGYRFEGKTKVTRNRLQYLMYKKLD